MLMQFAHLFGRVSTEFNEEEWRGKRECIEAMFGELTDDLFNYVTADVPVGTANRHAPLFVRGMRNLMCEREGRTDFRNDRT